MLSEGLPPVPVKLVEKTLKGEFVDMAALLRDNLEADRREAGSSEKSGSCWRTRPSSFAAPGGSVGEAGWHTIPCSGSKQRRR